LNLELFGSLAPPSIPDEQVLIPTDKKISADRVAGADKQRQLVV
jgi:hypothetical protein